MLRNLVLVDPGLGGGLPGDDLLWLEPESDLLLGVLDGVGTVADVASNIDAALCQCPRSRLLDAVYKTYAKSPRIVPGAEANGLVAPRRTRPVLTASLPSQTMAQIGPEFM